MMIMAMLIILIEFGKLNGTLFSLFMLIVAELSPNSDCLQIQYQGFSAFSEVLVDCID